MQVAAIIRNRRTGRGRRTWRAARVVSKARLSTIFAEHRKDDAQIAEVGHAVGIDVADAAAV